jgi:hypothetical protein
MNNKRKMKKKEMKYVTLLNQLLSILFLSFLFLLQWARGLKWRMTASQEGGRLYL